MTAFFKRPVLPPHSLRLDLGKQLQRQETRAHGRDVQRDRADRVADRQPNISRRRCAVLLSRKQGVDIHLCAGISDLSDAAMVAGTLE